MLYSLILILAIQLPMDKIINPPPKEVPVITKKVYIVIDKFNKEHEGEDKIKLIKEVQEINKQPFKLQDKKGITWEHSDEEYLKKWIQYQNQLQPQAMMITPACTAVS